MYDVSQCSRWTERTKGEKEREKWY